MFFVALFWNLLDDNPKNNAITFTGQNVTTETCYMSWAINVLKKAFIYPGQKIYYVIIDNYIYLVPHVVEKNYIFLKTIFPSRKATQLFLESKEKQNEI